MIEPNIIKLPTRLNIKFQDISKDNVLAKMAQETQTMAPSYEQNKAKIGEIHGTVTVNLGFKRPVHEGYTIAVNGTCTLSMVTVNSVLHVGENQPFIPWACSTSGSRGTQAGSGNVSVGPGFISGTGQCFGHMVWTLLISNYLAGSSKKVCSWIRAQMHINRAIIYPPIGTPRLPCSRTIPHTANSVL